MRFIELHRESDDRPFIINLDDIADIKPGETGRALVAFRSMYRNHDPMPLPTETYVETRGMVHTARILA